MVTHSASDRCFGPGSGLHRFAFSFGRKSWSVVVLCATVGLNGLSSQVYGQTPVMLPNTITTVAGNTPIATTVGGACASNPQFTAAGCEWQRVPGDQCGVRRQ